MQTDLNNHLTPIPVILDTDIGDDIDDTWALAMMLKSPELDVKLIAATYRNTRYRARIIAKLLDIADRSDIPIAIGPGEPESDGHQSAWVGDYTLDQYPGIIEEDGVGAIIKTIMDSPVPVTVISIGPLTNMAAALVREPRIADRVKFIGMHGSVLRGYEGSAEIAKEWNIVADIPSAQISFSAAWPMTITPLDTCGVIRLSGEKYQAVVGCDDILTRAVIENYRAWAKLNDWANPEVSSTVLFDTVAIYLAFSRDLLHIHPHGIRVTDDGLTVLDDNAKIIECALDWKEIAAFEDFLVARLRGEM